MFHKHIPMLQYASSTAINRMKQIMIKPSSFFITKRKLKMFLDYILTQRNVKKHINIIVTSSSVRNKPAPAFCVSYNRCNRTVMINKESSDTSHFFPLLHYWPIQETAVTQVLLTFVLLQLAIAAWFFSLAKNVSRVQAWQQTGRHLC